MPAPMTGPGRHESATYTAPPTDDGLVEFLLLALLGTLIPVAKGVWWLVSRHPVSTLVTLLFAAGLVHPVLADVTVPLAILVLAG